MKKKINLLIPISVCLLFATAVWGQTDFRAGWQKANPVPPESTPAFEEKVNAHQAFLDKATHDNNTLLRLYGFFYLFHDYLNARDFKEATHCLLEAETIAKVSNNPGWQGAVQHRKGILSIRLKNATAAIEPFKAAVALCRKAGDSLCVAESLEQLGAAYSLENDFGQAHRYYQLSFPLIEKYGSETSLAASLSNFGGLLTRQNRPVQAIPYFERALTIWRKAKSYKQEAQTMNNLGEAYYTLRRFDEGIATLNQCIRLNKEHNYPENMINNYACLSNLHELKGDLAKAMVFLVKYYDLRDSLVGAKTQLELADLETKYHSQQKELELQKSQTALTTSRRTLERGAAIAFCGLLLVAFGLWRWRIQIRHAKQALAQHEDALTALTRILLDKNTQLATLEERGAGQPPLNDTSPAPDHFLENLYNQQILTHADWSAFKASFEKAHPGYLLRLRTAVPTLSDAEERLFLLFKLNLNTKEAAAILGISAESVKRARNRLRKRLGLDEETALETYIRTF